MKTLLYSFCVLCLLGSCNRKANPLEFNSVVISADTLANLLADFHMVDAASKQNYIKNNIDNPAQYAQYKRILNKYQISKDRFDSTITFYSIHTKEFLVVYDSTIAILKKQDSLYNSIKHLPVSAPMGNQ